MNQVLAHRQVVAFLAITGLGALYIAISPGPDNNWVLTPLTGIVTTVTALFVGTRLALGTPSPLVHQLWRLAFALLILLGIAELVEPVGIRFGKYSTIEDVGDCVLLI